MEKKLAITSKSDSFVARAGAALRRLVVDNRGAEFVEVLVVVAVIALGGIVAMNKIKAGTDTAATAAQTNIGGITPTSTGFPE